MMDDPSGVFARRLREERKGRHLTQAQLAEGIAARVHRSIDAPTIVRMEQGARAVRLDEAVAIADALGVSLATLLGDAQTRLDDLREQLAQTTLEAAVVAARHAELQQHVAELEAEIDRLEERERDAEDLQDIVETLRMDQL